MLPWQRQSLTTSIRDSRAASVSLAGPALTWRTPRQRKGNLENSQWHIRKELSAIVWHMGYMCSWNQYDPSSAKIEYQYPVQMQPSLFSPPLQCELQPPKQMLPSEAWSLSCAIFFPFVVISQGVGRQSLSKSCPNLVPWYYNQGFVIFVWKLYQLTTPLSSYIRQPVPEIFHCHWLYWLSVALIQLLAIMRAVYGKEEIFFSLLMPSMHVSWSEFPLRWGLD